MKKFTITIFILLFFIAMLPAQSEDKFEVFAGFSNTSAWTDAAVTAGAKYDWFGLELSFAMLNVTPLKDMSIEYSGKLYEDDVLVDELSEELEFPDALSITVSGIIFGFMPYITMFNHQGIDIQIAARTNFILLNGEFNMKNVYESSTNNVTGNINTSAIEFIPQIRTEFQPWDIPISFNAAIGYSMTWLEDINGTLSYSLSNGTTSTKMDFDGIAKTNSFAGQTIFLLGGTVRF